MKGLTRLISILVVVGLAGAGVVQAQTEKTVRGEHDPTPYVSHAESQSSSVGGDPFPASPRAPNPRSETY